MKKFMKLVIIIFILLVIFNLAKNGIVQASLGAALSKASNVPVRIGGTDLSFMGHTLNLRNIRFYNPRNFPEKLMMDINQVFIKLDPWPLFRGQAHFQEAKLNLKEVIVIKNRDGQLNVEAMKPKKSGAKGKQAAGEGKQMQLKIDKLNLSIGRVVYKDYSQGAQPKIEVFDVNIKDREYRGIENPSALVSLIMFEALTRTSLSRLAGLDLNTFKQDFSQSLGVLTEGKGDVTEAAKGIFDLFK